jgi:2-succinyl-5-enolpyruvyl-6-hydroxy-3-cyclohexene-1-carboxylate synthase
VNPSTALARVLVDELVARGRPEAVLAPGSRSAPLAFALHDADRDGRLRLHVRIDERSAAVPRAGAGQGLGPPRPGGHHQRHRHREPAPGGARGVVLRCAAAGAHRRPAGRAARHRREPDRRPVGLYGGAVRLFVELGTPRPGPASRPSGGRAPAGCWPRRGATWAARRAGAREPGAARAPGARRRPGLGGAAGGSGRTAPRGRCGSRLQQPAAPLDDLPRAHRRGARATGPGRRPSRPSAWPDAAGWPVVAEPSSGAHPTAEVLLVPELLLSAPGWLAAHRPDRVLVVGRPTMSRAVGRLIAGSPSDVVAGLGQLAGPQQQRVAGAPGGACRGPAGARGAGSSTRAGWRRGGRPRPPQRTPRRSSSRRLPPRATAWWSRWWRAGCRRRRDRPAGRRQLQAGARPVPGRSRRRGLTVIANRGAAGHRRHGVHGRRRRIGLRGRPLAGGREAAPGPRTPCSAT